MAKQDSSPPKWDHSMSDGCSGVLDLGFTQACINHDRAYHYGGSVEDKLIADSNFHKDMSDTPGFWGVVARNGLAAIRYAGVRDTTYNYPPGHPQRDEYSIRFEAWNWLGKPEGNESGKT